MDVLELLVCGDAKICVPGSSGLLTTYVLLEQEDWFEKEIRFVRRMLEPGMRALDVGANYGVYTVAMARAVGPAGRVWSIEPASGTTAYLQQTLARNGLGHVQALRCALSDHGGIGRLGLNENPELNSLTAGPGQTVEEVPLATLDELAVTAAISGLDFMKLDAEGEELGILAGGRAFFERESPLVMLEVKQGDAFNFAPIRDLRARGYDVYRLVGPDRLLVPSPVDETIDIYELNLLACKPDRASRLAARGLLLQESGDGTSIRAGGGAGLARWRAEPFASSFGSPLRKVPPDYFSALDAYAVWRDTTRPVNERVAGLRAALDTLARVATSAPAIETSSMLARVAHEAGERRRAVQALGELLERSNAAVPTAMAPCWPACERFDRVAPVGDARAWLVAAAAEAFVRWANYSDYFSGPTTLPLLDFLQATPYASVAMERRRQLQAIAAGRQSAILPSRLLAAGGPDHLNVEVWSRDAPQP